MLKKSKRGGVSLSVILLVILTSSLVAFSLFLFQTKITKFESNIGKSLILENTYSSKEIINFNIQNIVDISAKESKSKEEFINHFKENLNKYKNVKGEYIIRELSQLENQLFIDKIVYDSHLNKFEVQFEIKIETNNVENGLFVDYIYTKTFINN
ncbi:MAG: hypothetical protein QW727_02545 [Candidatus Pacearchaeota archaeon]